MKHKTDHHLNIQYVEVKAFKYLISDLGTKDQLIYLS